MQKLGEGIYDLNGFILDLSDLEYWRTYWHKRHAPDIDHTPDRDIHLLVTNIEEDILTPDGWTLIQGYLSHLTWFNFGVPDCAFADDPRWLRNCENGHVNHDHILNTMRGGTTYPTRYYCIANPELQIKPLGNFEEMTNDLRMKRIKEGK